MPYRHRTHRLEDESLRAFEEALPATWVSRTRSHDYGIDREVEIFEDDGAATGLVFLVQMRATDDPARAGRTRLKVDQLEYFHLLGLPVAVVRYCSADRSLRWRWETAISSGLAIGEGQVNVTISFGEEDRWTDATAPRMRRTLEIRRAIEGWPSARAVPVRIDASGLPTKARYATELALRRAVEACGRSFRIAVGASDGVELSVSFLDDGLRVRLDDLASVRVAEVAPEQAADIFLHAAAVVLDRRGLSLQATLVARTAIRRARPIRHRHLAVMVALVLTADPAAAVGLALLNGIEARQDEAYAALVAGLLSAPSSEDERRSALLSFYEAALAAATGDAERAAIRYSAGNLLRSARRDADAVRAFNSARRLRPEYLQAAYFLRELGACLFSARRYRASAEAYRRVLGIEDEATDRLHLADALFGSGRVRDAGLHYEEAAKRGAGCAVAEARLKSEACRWLDGWLGPVVPTMASKIAEAHREADEQEVFDHWYAMVTEVDATSHLAHFNLGVIRAERGDFAHAFGDFLVCGILRSGDAEAWSNAAICALRAGEAELLAATLSVAHALSGEDAYERLREDLLAQGVSDELLLALDGSAAIVDQHASASDAPNAITVRSLRPDGFDIVAAVRRD